MFQALAVCVGPEKVRQVHANSSALNGRAWHRVRGFHRNNMQVDGCAKRDIHRCDMVRGMCMVARAPAKNEQWSAKQDLTPQSLYGTREIHF